MDMIIYTLRALSNIIFNPVLLITISMLVVIFYMKNKKIVAMQRMIIGEELKSAFELTISQLVLGLLAGIVASIVFSALGVIFSQTSGIQYLFLISLLIMFIKPRFICFSYSGFIIGSLSIILSIVGNVVDKDIMVFDIDILCLMTFIGVMHIIEGILVIFDGDSGSIPVFANKGNKIIGGHAFSRYWSIPVAIFIAISMKSGADISSEVISTPSWWPLINTEYITTIISASLLSVLPFFGIVGYSSISFTSEKRKKTLSSGLFILGFGLILTLLAQFCRVGIIGEIIVVFFAPIGHELMLYIQRKVEDKREPLFYSDENGISILEIIPNSQLDELGVREGDKIISLNGNKINSEKEIYKVIKENKGKATLQILNKLGEIKEVSLNRSNKRGIGALLVPTMVNKENVVPVKSDSFSEVLHKINNNDKTE